MNIIYLYNIRALFIFTLTMLCIYLLCLFSGCREVFKIHVYLIKINKLLIIRMIETNLLILHKLISFIILLKFRDYNVTILFELIEINL